MNAFPYRGRLAPSPTGYLHLGHARTFWIAARRAQARAGRLVLRIDDLDRARCRPEFESALLEDLAWLGLTWQDGPGPCRQSERLARYAQALATLHAQDLIYPCPRSRRDLAEMVGAPHEDGAGEQDEPVYPRELRPPPGRPPPPPDAGPACNWRMRVPDGERLAFADGGLGPQAAVAGIDFGDFLVWRKDGLPSYQLASVVDDIALEITEVVRGADLVRSTFRQLLLWRAFARPPPDFCHCPLLRDAAGARLAKRHDALSLRTLRARGTRPEEILAGFAAAGDPTGAFGFDKAVGAA